MRRRLAKSPALRLSNWEARPLCAEQQQYAALDALASLLLHEVTSDSSFILADR